MKLWYKISLNLWQKYIQYYNPRLKNKLKNFFINRHSIFWSNIETQCITHRTNVNQPLILISQIQRSGGTLLSQLFDGHPQIHAHPYELRIGNPRKFNWPDLNLAETPQNWFATLFEAPIIDLIFNGYSKGNYDKTYLFSFHPSLQKKIFLEELKNIKLPTKRLILDAYMTSYFNAWLNNQNISGDKTYVSTFVARMNMYEKNLTEFFDIYPDGFFISIIRDPFNWYASAKKHDDSYLNLESSMELWEQSTKSCLINKHRFQDRVILLKFDDLINNPKKLMSNLAEYLKIDFNDILLLPTFNGDAIKSNSSFQSIEGYICKQTLERQSTLTNDEINLIKSKVSDLYHEAISLTITLD